MKIKKGIEKKREREKKTEKNVITYIFIIVNRSGDIMLQDHRFLKNFHGKNTTHAHVKLGSTKTGVLHVCCWFLRFRKGRHVKNFK